LRKFWNFWHYSDNSTLDDEADRQYKVRPILNNLVEKFRKHYKPPQELSLDEAMITWSGRLRFRTYNPGKLVKYGILLRTVCGATTGYMEIYTAEGKKLEVSTFSVLEPHLELWHHVYQGSYYNSVEIAEKLLLRKTLVCGKIRINRGTPKSLADSSKKLKRDDAICRRKGEVHLHIWKVKKEACMISTIYNGIIGEVTNKFGEKKNNFCNSVQVHEGC
jgi:hypothetical protein